MALTLTAAAILFLFVHPLGDDWCHAADVKEWGLVGCVQAYYMHLSGRWSGFAASCAALAWDGDLVPWYRASLVAIFGFGVLSVWFLVVSLLRLPPSRPLPWFLALGFSALHWAGMAAPGQTVYWLEGALAYSLSVSLAIVIVACLLRLPTNGGAGYWSGALGLAALASVTGAFHELVTLLFGAVLAAGAVVAFVRRDPRRVAWVLVGAGCGASFATIFFAPGNDSRVATGATLGPGEHLVAALRGTVGIALRALDVPMTSGSASRWGSPLGWVLDPKLLAASLLFATSASMRAARPAWLMRDLELWKWVIPGVWMATLLGGFFAGSYAALMQGADLGLPGRVYDAYYRVFLLGWFLTLWVHTRWDLDAERRDLRMMHVVSALVLAVGLVFSSSFKLGIRDLVTGDAAAFDHQMNRRLEAARRAGDGTDLVVAPIQRWPEIYFRGTTSEITTDRDYFYNECAAHYLGVGSIRLSRTPEGWESFEPRTDPERRRPGGASDGP